MVKDELEKVTLNLRVGDFARLRELHPDLPAGLVVRKLVTDHIEKMEQKLSEVVDELEGVKE